MSLQFPLDPDCVERADAAVLFKNGGRPLTMSNEDCALRAEWLVAYNKALAQKTGVTAPELKPDSDPQDLKQRCPAAVKRKNIIFIGSEHHYDSFWLKMMFIAPGYTTAKGGGPLRPADLTTVAYVNDAYTFLEKLPLETLREKHGCKLVTLASSDDIIAAMNDTADVEENGRKFAVKLQDVVFFTHGLPSEITLNFEGSYAVTLDRTNLKKIRSDIFVDGGSIWSYACRTGNASLAPSFTSDAGAKPRESLAQKMAERFDVTVHAFISRSFYGKVIRDPALSDVIAKLVRDKREGHEHEVLNLSNAYEALPHPGLAETGSAFWGTGPIGEGTNGFALWYKAGALGMPGSGDTPKGLTPGLIEFKPGPIEFKP